MTYQAHRHDFKQSAKEVAMRLDVVSAFDFLSDEYSALFRASKATPFQAGFWLARFYDTLVPSLGAEPLIILGRDPVTEALSFVLPMIRQSKMGMKLVQPADLGISDYNVAIGTPETLASLTKDEAFKADLTAALQPFDLCIYRKQRADLFNTGSLLTGGDESPSTTSSYGLTITDDIDTWRQNTLSKSTRKGLGRKRRAIENDLENVVFRTLVDHAEIDHAMRFLQHHRGLKYKNDLLSQSTYFDFYLKIAQENALSGEARTSVLEVDGTLVAVDFGLEINGQHLFILGSYVDDEAYNKYSVGHLNMIEIMRLGRQKDITYFDFTIGDEPYKQTLRCEQIAMTNTIVTNSLRGKLGKRIYQNQGGVKDFVKKLAPGIN